jgi:hypothetical protein
LILVAFHQIYLAKTVQLSPWKGGGFGMFSSTEYGPARYVRIYVTGPNRSEELLIPESLEDSASRASTLPSDRMLRRLATNVVAREQRNGRPIERVKIEVWRTEFDPTSLAATPKKIREYDYAVAGTTE